MRNEITRTRVPANLPAIALVAGAGAVLFFFDPVRHGFFPTCLFHKLTGWNCPGCGATRALHSLLHGEVRAGLRDNALVAGVLPLLVGLEVWNFFRRRRGQRTVSVFTPFRLWLVLAVMAVFTVLRNLPAFAWLSPQ